MAPRAEARRRRVLARSIGLGVLLLAAIPIYVSLSPSWRAAAVRLACAALVIVGGARAVRWLKEMAAGRPRSAVDAPPPAAPAIALDSRFTALCDDLVSSRRSRRYFDVILWPRLCELAGRPLPRPARRRKLLARRGPPLAAIERLVAEVERGT